MNLQADEMTTEVMENAANAATKRREMRRRKILADPNERMRKLVGYNNSPEGLSQQSYQEDMQNGPNMNIANQRQLGPINQDFSQQQDITARFDGLRHVQQDVFAERQPRPRNLGYSTSFGNERFPTTESGLGVQTVDGQRVPSKAFNRFRHFLCLFLGVVVRISLMYSIGRRFVQSIINPYVFLEVAIIGYQRAEGIEFGSNVRGGLWLSTLLLAGIRNDVIQSYKSIMGTIAAAVDDFTLYFFAFVFSHLICLLFE